MAPRRPFVVDPVLTAIAVGFRNTSAMRIADQVLPRSTVGGEKFSWTEYPIEEAFNTPDARVGRLGRVQQLTFSGTRKTDEVDDYGLDAPVPFDDIEAAENQRVAGLSNYDPEGRAVEVLSDTIENIREVRVANLVHNSDSYSAGRKVTLSGGDQLSDFDNSDPVDVIKTAIHGTLIYRANTAVMGTDVWTKISSHPKLLNAVKGGLTSEGMITPRQFVDLFAGEGLKNLLIGDAWVNAAKPGQDVNLQRAWGKHIAMLHINPMADVQGGGVTFGLTAEYGGKVSGRIEDPDIGLNGGYRIRRGERVKELSVAPDLGYFIQDAVE